MTDLLRQEIATSAETIIVKVGTQVLTGADGQLDRDQIIHLADQLSKLCNAGRRVVLVSSGAVGAGMGRLKMTQRPTSLAMLQAVAAIGQNALVEAYDHALRRHKRHAAQVLLTADDLNDRTRYLNARNTLRAILELDALPIINENDTVSVDELQTTFGDNDRLAAMVTNLLRAPLLVLLSDVEGLYDRDPSDPDAKVIPTVMNLDESIRSLVCDKKNGRSKGGMTSKLEAARMTTTAGENVIIARGTRRNVLTDIMAGEPIGTLFVAKGATVAARKRWIGLTVQPHGVLELDAGACHAIQKGGSSLLPAGIVATSGIFEKGDVVSLRTSDGLEIARGLTNYSVEDVRSILGLKTEEIESALGHRPYDEVVHRDNMVLLT